MDYGNIEWNDKIDISKEQWKEIFINDELIKPYNKDLILRIYEKPNYMATATEIAEDEGKLPNSYNSAVGQLGKRIAKHMGIEAPRQKSDNTEHNYWHVMFLGARQNNSKHFLWILRPELKEAIEELISEGKLCSKAQEMSTIAEEISEMEAVHLFEGAKKQITVNAYERNPEARQECIKEYGYKCCVCEFDFEEYYGDIGKGFIEVHHLKPLNEINKEYEVNPLNDLRPICPNCHSMLHRAKISINQLRDRIKKR